MNKKVNSKKDSSVLALIGLSKPDAETLRKQCFNMKLINKTQNSVSTARKKKRSKCLNLKCFQYKR